MHSKAYLPHLLGANAIFVPRLGIPLLSEGDVVDLSLLLGSLKVHPSRSLANTHWLTRLSVLRKTGSETLMGHLYGGLISDKPNFGTTDASDLLFAVKVVKN